MRKVGILGGTFNPVHTEHVAIACAAINSLGLEKLIVEPTCVPPHKTAAVAPSEYRSEMLRIAFSNNPEITVGNYEINKGGKSYTVETVKHYFETENAELYFICGADMFKTFSTWKTPDKILSYCKLAVAGRKGENIDLEKHKEKIEKEFGTQVFFINYEGEKVSSSAIREYVALNVPTDNMLPLGVREYIDKKGLYFGDKYERFIAENLPLKRRKHTADVVLCALKKAEETGIGRDKIRIAATLHDCAKYLNPKDYSGFILPPDVPKPVEHQFLGAFVAENVLGVKDEEILDAIRYHTSGKADMSLLGKLIFVADMVEDGRDYEGVDALRKAYEGDLNECFTECLKEEFLHLINKKNYVYRETVNAFAYYVKEK